MDGLVVLARKDKDEVGPIKGKKSKATKAKPKAIKHNAETFQLFARVKVDAPITLDDIQPTLEKLEAQLAKLQEKVKEWERKRREEAEQKAAEADALATEEQPQEDEQAGLAEEPADDPAQEGADVEEATEQETRQVKTSMLRHCLRTISRTRKTKKRRMHNEPAEILYVCFHPPCIPRSLYAPAVVPILISFRAVAA
ncbi:unnamed protein product [Prorocentrum cordatum]|uniref:Uncharacterized protein n=1 Tax=Prorocentrum cordatum TaxID=2364126 RepID=A0ABN9V587_9DINO|nr:unnamed protein product [Polarella glacialis]